MPTPIISAAVRKSCQCNFWRCGEQTQAPPQKDSEDTKGRVWLGIAQGAGARQVGILFTSMNGRMEDWDPSLHLKRINLSMQFSRQRISRNHRQGFASYIPCKALKLKGDG
jgi:hypothetical protein